MTPQRPFALRKLSRAILTIGLGSLLLTGCVRRTVTINTAPQGAIVTLNDREIGASPVTVGFLWHGDYDVILRKEGYQTLSTHHRIETPWYELPPFDLVAETLVPGTIEDHHEMSFSLEPSQPINHDELRQQAVDFRDRTLFSNE